MTHPAVLQVLGPSQGGIGRHVAFLVHGLRDRWDVTVCAPPEVRDLVSASSFVPAPVRAHPRAAVGARRVLRPLVAASSVVHAHGLTATWHAWLAGAGRRRDRPLVASLHNIVLRETHGRAAAVLRRLEAVVPRLADVVICPSSDIAARLPASTRGRVHVVRAGVNRPEPQHEREDTRRRLGLDDNDEVVLVPARLHPQKALPVMLAAVRQIATDRPRLRVLVAGAGPEEDLLREEITARGLGGTVQLLGFRDDVADLLVAADVVALSSVWEARPLAIAEAMALGRPVVATAVGGIPDLVEDGATGRLVPPGDPGALADALADTLANPERSAAWGEAGRRKAENELSEAAALEAVEAIYREVMA